MNRDILQAFQTGSALGGAFQNLDQYEHERAVKGRMDELLGEAGQYGGDITMLDASRYSDRAGLEAMGRLAAQYSQTEQGKANIMRNNVIQAKHRYGMLQQYLKDVDDAVKSGDQQRVVGLLSNAGSLGGVPYRFTPTEDGRIAVSYIDPDGVHDKGAMTMMEAFEELKARMATKGRFIRDSVMFGMGVQEENMARMMNPGSWKTVTDARGNQYTMIPQVFQRNGQYESGFMVSGPGVHGNMTLEEVQRRGLMAAPAGGLGGTGALPKNLEMYAMDYAVGEDGKQQKFVNPYKYDVISKAVAFGQDPALVMATWDQRMAEVLKAAPNMPREQASIVVYQNFMKAAGGAPAPAPTKTPDALNLAIGRNTGGGGIPGMVQPGNIDLTNRPRVKNADGSISTVRSMSINVDGKEVLIPTVSDDGRILSDKEAVDLFRTTGKHLGIFDSPEAATAYAEQLHKEQEAMYSGKTRPERVNGQWMDVTRNEKGEVVDMQPSKKSGKGRSTFADWRKGVSASLREGEEDYRKKAGPGLQLSGDYLHR